MMKQKEFRCDRPGCDKVFSRTPHNSQSTQLYCSRACAVHINNSKFPKRKAKIAQCAYCKKDFKGQEIYCSLRCKNDSQVIGKKEILRKISAFQKEHGRIPLKREFLHYSAARDRFGSWNLAITAAGFKPNPVLFAERHHAQDGHMCDSLAEKIIDDWLYERNIPHRRNEHYPGNPKLTADFVTDTMWIEFFGLKGELKKYDKSVREKLRLAKEHQLPLMALYPKDLFPRNKLAILLKS